MHEEVKTMCFNEKNRQIDPFFAQWVEWLQNLALFSGCSECIT